VLAPQQLTVPSEIKAHECESPEEIADTELKPETATGIELLVDDPIPNCPAVLAPQHLTVPSENKAHEWFEPAATWVAIIETSEHDVGISYVSTDNCDSQSISWLTTVGIGNPPQTPTSARTLDPEP
jgi:hypothetical protein